MIFMHPFFTSQPSSGAAWRRVQGCIKTTTFSARAGRGVECAAWVADGVGVDGWHHRRMKPSRRSHKAGYPSALLSLA
ncbi:hypothetical protein DDR56_04365 [Halomonas venusta]|uniref:Uncharacterized protein n=1 Tax=Vreelandella venusta TaxID=44935 RepID=A0ABX2B6S7_9GAMM|nr:hypothetical protein [Halomonas venusta]